MTPRDRASFCRDCGHDDCTCDQEYEDGRERGLDRDYPPLDEVTDGE